MVIKINYRILMFLTFFILITFCLILFSKSEAIKEQSGENKEIRVPIIMYHSILIHNNRGSSNTITPNEFENDLKYIKENGYTTIMMSDLIGYVYGENELPEKPLIITFDDGFLNNYVYALPLLKKYDCKATLSIIGICTDKFTQITSNDLEYSHLTWEQLNQMVESGRFEIQNHTYDLHKSTNKRVGAKKRRGESLSDYENLLSDDIGGFQQQITDMLGCVPNTFVYPYGSISKESDQIIKKLGFKASFSTNGGVNKITKDPNKLFGLKRNDRPHGMTSKSFFKRVYRISGMTE